VGNDTIGALGGDGVIRNQAESDRTSLDCTSRDTTYNRERFRPG
jgi:hypothetical protein